MRCYSFILYVVVFYASPLSGSFLFSPFSCPVTSFYAEILYNSMTKLCCELFKCEDKLKICWGNKSTALYCTQMRARVKKWTSWYVTSLESSTVFWIVIYPARSMISVTITPMVSFSI